MRFEVAIESFAKWQKGKTRTTATTVTAATVATGARIVNLGMWQKEKT